MTLSLTRGNRMKHASYPILSRSAPVLATGLIALGLAFGPACSSDGGTSSNSTDTTQTTDTAGGTDTQGGDSGPGGDTTPAGTGTLTGAVGDEGNQWTSAPDGEEAEASIRATIVVAATVDAAGVVQTAATAVVAADGSFTLEGVAPTDSTLIVQALTEAGGEVVGEVVVPDGVAAGETKKCMPISPETTAEADAYVAARAEVVAEADVDAYFTSHDGATVQGVADARAALAAAVTAYDPNDGVTTVTEALIAAETKGDVLATTAVEAALAATVQARTQLDADLTGALATADGAAAVGTAWADFHTAARAAFEAAVTTGALSQAAADFTVLATATPQIDLATLLDLAVVIDTTLELGGTVVTSLGGQLGADALVSGLAEADLGSVTAVELAGVSDG